MQQQQQKGNNQAAVYVGNQCTKISRTVMLMLALILAAANIALSVIAWNPESWVTAYVIPHFGVFFSLSIMCFFVLILWIMQFKIVEV